LLGAAQFELWLPPPSLHVLTVDQSLFEPEDYEPDFEYVYENEPEPYAPYASAPVVAEAAAPSRLPFDESLIPMPSGIRALPTPEPTEAQSAARTGGQSQGAARRPPARAPTRMRIPALSLDYGVRGRGVDARGNMIIEPSISIITWLNASSLPGNRGNSIFAGHNTWRGERSKLFTLNELSIGDYMEIDFNDGTMLRFRLESVFIYELATAPNDRIMDLRGGARVTLITCAPPFNPRTGTSDNRIVATFREESLFVVPDPPIRPFPPRRQ